MKYEPLSTFRTKHDRPNPKHKYYTIDALPPELYKDTLRPKVTLQTDTGIQVFNKDGSPQLE